MGLSSDSWLGASGFLPKLREIYIIILIIPAHTCIVFTP